MVVAFECRRRIGVSRAGWARAAEETALLMERARLKESARLPVDAAESVARAVEHTTNDRLLCRLTPTTS